MIIPFKKWDKFKCYLKSALRFGSQSIAVHGYGGSSSEEVKLSTYSLLYIKMASSFFEELNIFYYKKMNEKIPLDRISDLICCTNSNIPILLDFYKLHKIRCTRNRLAHQPDFFIDKDIFQRDFELLEKQLKKISIF